MLKACENSVLHVTNDHIINISITTQKDAYIKQSLKLLVFGKCVMHIETNTGTFLTGNNKGFKEMQRSQILFSFFSFFCWERVRPAANNYLHSSHFPSKRLIILQNLTNLYKQFNSNILNFNCNKSLVKVQSKPFLFFHYGLLLYALLSKRQQVLTARS